MRGGARRSVLHQASKQASRELIQFVLDLGFDTEERDAKGMTPLLIAAARGNEAGVKILGERGAKWDVVNELDGSSPLTLACNKGYDGIVQYLETLIYPVPPSSSPEVLVVKKSLIRAF